MLSDKNSKLGIGFLAMIIFLFTYTAFFWMSSDAFADTGNEWQECETGKAKFPLHDAIKSEDKEGVLCLLERGFDPNAQWVNGLSVLILANSRSLEITKLIIDHGADVNRDNGKAIEYAISKLGFLIEGRNSGDEYFISQYDLPFEKLDTLSEKITESANTVYTLLDAGADFNLVFNMHNDLSVGSRITGFASDICGNNENEFYKYEDYAVYLDEIAKRAKYKIRFTQKDAENFKKMRLLSSLGLYDLSCLEHFSMRFDSEI